VQHDLQKMGFTYPMGTLRCFDVDTTSISRRDVVSTLYRRRSNVVCPLGRLKQRWQLASRQIIGGVRVWPNGLLLSAVATDSIVFVGFFFAL